MRRLVMGLVLGWMACAGAQAQAVAAGGSTAAAETATVAGKASITGHVYLSDTNGPARFALVLVKQVPDAASAEAAKKKLAAMMEEFKGKNDDADAKAQQAAMAKMFSTMGELNLSAVVGADGTYTISGVKPGTYYVHAVMAGYIDPMKSVSSEDQDSTDAETQKRVQESVASVTVNGDEPAHLDLRLERGAAISGHVSFDDGSPAAGWMVSVIPVKKAADGTVALPGADDGIPNIMDAMEKIMHVTDDRGQYRIAGLAAGDYIVRADLNTKGAGTGSGGMLAGGLLGGGGILKLTVMSGNVTHRQDATPVSVAAGEDRGDVNLVMPLSTLHVISGHVLAKADAHPLNAGEITLVEDGTGPATIFHQESAVVQPDGSFRFDYIPNGHYTLKISGAKITEATGKSKSFLGIDEPETKTLRQFAKGEQKVAVQDGDVSNVTFTLADVPVAKDDDDDGIGTIVH